jgi:hypothetical protein
MENDELDRDRCWGCRFWSQDIRDEEPLGTGQCRRYAPRPSMNPKHKVTSVEPAWPETKRSDWCGEHESHPPGGKDAA